MGQQREQARNTKQGRGRARVELGVRSFLKSFYLSILACSLRTAGSPGLPKNNAANSPFCSSMLAPRSSILGSKDGAAAPNTQNQNLNQNQGQSQTPARAPRRRPTFFGQQSSVLHDSTGRSPSTVTEKALHSISNLVSPGQLCEKHRAAAAEREQNQSTKRSFDEISNSTPDTALKNNLSGFPKGKIGSEISTIPPQLVEAKQQTSSLTGKVSARGSLWRRLKTSKTE